MQSPRMAGKKRGRPPLQPAPIKMAVPNLFSAPAGALPVLKVPKKRGRKPGHKLKSRVLMTPLAISPPRSTPEPDISSIPQDAATVPNSDTPQALTVCIYVNKQGNLGPYLDRKKVQQLPEHFGPERPSAALQQAVQACIDCALQQKVVFSLIRQGYGGEMVSGKGFVATREVLEVLTCPLILTALDVLFPSVGWQPALNITYAFTAGVAWFKSLAAGTFFLPQQGPKGFMFFNSIHQLGSCLPISSQIGNFCKSRFFPLLPSQATTCTQRSNVQGCSGAAKALHTHNHKPRKTLHAIVTHCCGLFVLTASSPSPEGEDAARPSSKNPLTWTVEDVVWFVKDADPQALGPHVELFRKHEIDGNALLLLKSDMIMKYLGLKLGPALKLCYHIDKLKQAKF
ncbi:SCML4 protein, partial [Prunella fulvescens]|nr:SCML4 protein [Prunella fulvescens]